MALKCLERASVLQTLNYLYNQKSYSTNITELYKNVKNASETINFGVRMLAEKGLVRDKQIRSFPPQRVVALTTAGVFVASRLSEIEQFLASSKPPKP